MLVEEVNKLSTKERFIYWITERHSIYLKRLRKLPKPWTDDVILQSYFFTNPYRENDRVTKWFRSNIRDPYKGVPKIGFMTMAFRWFNLPATGKLLLNAGLLTNWQTDVAIETLNYVWDGGANPVFTGAYMIKAGNGPPGCKIPNVCKAIETVWNIRDELAEVCLDNKSLEAAFNYIKDIDHIGPFMAAQVVADLKYTSLLAQDRTKDWWTWCSLGPGGMRGFQRITETFPTGPIPENYKPGKPSKGWEVTMGILRGEVNSQLPQLMPKMHTQDIQHCLCEFDKYERARLGQGRMKRNYPGT